MTYEYKLLRARDIRTKKERESLFNEYGEKGWLFAGHDHYGYWVFVREIAKISQENILPFN